MFFVLEFGFFIEKDKLDWKHNQCMLVGNMILLLNLIILHMIGRNGLEGRKGPEVTEKGIIAQGIKTLKMNIQAAKQSPDFIRFLVAAFFHRQSIGMWTNLMVPVVEALNGADMVLVFTIECF